MLGGEAIVDCDHDGGRVMRDSAADGIVCIEAASEEAAAVGIDHDGQIGCRALRFVDTQRNAMAAAAWRKLLNYRIDWSGFTCPPDAGKLRRALLGNGNGR